MSDDVAARLAASRPSGVTREALADLIRDEYEQTRPECSRRTQHVLGWSDRAGRRAGYLTLDVSCVECRLRLADAVRAALDGGVSR